MTIITLPQQNIKMDVPTGIDPVWYGKLQALIKQINLLSGITPPAGATPITASLGADVALNNIANYFTGPQIAQGTVGTWFVSGTVSVLDTAGAANMRARLWDGTNIIDSGTATCAAANLRLTISLSGFMVSPANNLRISVRDITSTSGLITFNGSGDAKDSTISAFRIA